MVIDWLVQMFSLNVFSDDRGADNSFQLLKQYFHLVYERNANAGCR